MTVESIPVTDLLPHGPEMTLLDALVASTDDCTIARVTVTRNSEFAESGGVPGYVGLEYMAQTIAARVGYEAYAQGVSPPIGFLLGTRSYTCYQPIFAFGSELVISVKPLFVDGEFGSFECAIQAESLLASAVLNTYQPAPENLAAFGKE